VSANPGREPRTPLERVVQAVSRQGEDESSADEDDVAQGEEPNEAKSHELSAAAKEDNYLITVIRAYQ